MNRTVASLLNLLEDRVGAVAIGLKVAAGAFLPVALRALTAKNLGLSAERHVSVRPETEQPGCSDLE